jgi:hypothetical protein
MKGQNYLITNKVQKGHLTYSRLSVVLILFFLPQFFYCQDTIYLNYGQGIHLVGNTEKYNFEIFNKTISKYLVGTEINSYIFDTPGEFFVRPTEFVEPKYFGKKLVKDEYDNLPSLIYCHVDSLQLKFDANTFTFSKSLVVGNKFDNVLMSIECEIQNFYKSPIQFPNKKMKVKAAGIGARVEGDLIEVKRMSDQNRYVFIYRIVGEFKYRGYFQFDFEDFKSNLIPIGWHEEIK